MTTTQPATGPIGQRAAGNRVLMIGDSVLASTATRYSNDMCEALVPLGWRVELDAEVGRFIEFGDRVLDARLDAGWDVVAFLLGNNFDDDIDAFNTALNELVTRVSPRQVLLITVSEFASSRRRVNEGIRYIDALHEHASLMDWATLSRADGLLGDDDLHLTPSGRNALAVNTASALGRAPQQPGECLPASFRNDSAGSVDGASRGTSTTPARGTSAPRTTLAAPRTTARTTARTTPSGTAPSGTSPSGTARSGTAPSGTAPSGAAPSGTAPSGTVATTRATTPATTPAAPSTASPATTPPLTAPPTQAATTAAPTTRPAGTTSAGTPPPTT